MNNKIEKVNKIFSDIWEAISGTEQDFTKGSIKRAIFLLAVPMVLEMIMESIFAIVDIIYVSRLGPEAIATVGITESLITIVYAIGVGLAMAATAMVSRRIGEKDKKGANKAAFQAIITGLFVSLFIAIPGILFASDLLKLMGAEEVIYTEMSSYTAIMLGGNAVIMLLFIINAVFRSAGDAAISFRVLLVANGLNIVLDPIFIFGLGPVPEMGVMGAAVATNTGRGIAVIYQFYLLFKGNKRIKLAIENIRIHFETIRQLIKLSVGTISQYLIATSSWILLYRIISEFGSEALAGYTVAIRIIIFALLPSWGISNAAATLVGQNLGAKQPERAEKSVWVVGRLNIMIMGIISVILILFPQTLVKLITSETVIYGSATLSLRVIAFGFALYGLGMVLIQAINGAGDTITPTKINFVCFWILEIPLAYLLALQLNIGESGVYYAIVVAESIMTLIALWYFRRGRWKLKKV